MLYHPDYIKHVLVDNNQNYIKGRGLALTKPDSPASKLRPRYAYFPFGGGPRLCIGEPFAWLEGVLLIASLAQQFCFRLAPAARIEPQPLVTLRPRYGAPVMLHRRGENLYFYKPLAARIGVK